MSKDHGSPRNQDHKIQNELIARTFVAVDNKGGPTTRSVENVTIGGPGANALEDEKATQPENPASVGAGTGNDAADQDERADLEALERVSTRTPVHSIFSKRKKRFIVFMTAWGGLFSPISANIYFAALNPLAKALNVSDPLINLT